MKTCSYCQRPETDNFPLVSKKKRLMLLGFVPNHSAPICSSCFGARNPKRILRKTDALLRASIDLTVKNLSEGLCDDSTFTIENEMRAEVQRYDGQISEMLMNLNRLNKDRNHLFTKLLYVERQHAELIQKQYRSRRREANSFISQREIRLLIFLRDDFKCLSCGSVEKLTIDHKIPVVDGGSDELENLQTLCKSCNCAKGRKRHAALAVTVGRRIGEVVI